jgi:hypothetical protein
VIGNANVNLAGKALTALLKSVIKIVLMVENVSKVLVTVLPDSKENLVNKSLVLMIVLIMESVKIKLVSVKKTFLE